VLKIWKRHINVSTRAVVQGYAVTVLILLTIYVAYYITGLLKDKNLPRSLTEKTAFSNVRGVNEETEDSSTTFWYFFSALVPSIAGKKIWTQEVMLSKLIQESLFVTVVDEAFTILCIENYWEKWVNKGEVLWTETHQGSTGFMGWQTAGYERFVYLCKRIKHQRQETVSEDLEEKFKERAVDKFGGSRGLARRRLGTSALETFDQLDDA
jgi:hypothetical protein